MNIFIYILQPDQSVKKVKIKSKKFEKKISDNTMIIDGSKYMINNKAFFTYEFKRFFGLYTQYQKYVFYIKNNPEPLSYKNIGNDIKLILRQHLVSEFLQKNKTDFLLSIILMIMGLAIGIVVGIVLYPHIFPAAVSSVTNSTLHWGEIIWLMI